MSLPCEKTEVIDMIKTTVIAIDAKVDTLLEAKHKSDGRATIIAGIVSFVIAVVTGWIIFKLSR